MVSLLGFGHYPIPFISASACSSQYVMPMSSRYIVVAVARCSRVTWGLPVGPIELAEAELAVRDEGAHAEFDGEILRLTVVTRGRTSRPLRSRAGTGSIS